MAQLLVTAPTASSANVSGVVSAGVTWDRVVRTITAAGSGVHLRITASPVDLAVWWYRCDDRGVGGVPVLFPAGDRTRRRIGGGFRAGTRFCLAVSGPASGLWHGIVDWNVHS
ncbi:hypothetical protein BBK82_01905 [Lentzea guizhouensis]|uniref:Uncharacterized protein n=1 Tax=Lentzea guizhouensis TaxID=1586287 RepID=A0A1B2HBC7_9PSEU|nr:hypothetical protein [Lentzea guizhouensis]ANZ35012.1 hypothetical protein BBK82_01905 [Lentzea guizhouensis]